MSAPIVFHYSRQQIAAWFLEGPWAASLPVGPSVSGQLWERLAEVNA